MPPTRLMYQLWHETAWRALVAAPLALARPFLDRASREDGDA